MIRLLCLDSLLKNSLQKKGVSKPFEFKQSCQVCKNGVKRSIFIKCETNSKPKQATWRYENDTSVQDCIHMNAIERFKHATSLQVLYEDLQIYQDDVKTIEDWMIILERLEAMQILNPKLYQKCIKKLWMPIGKRIIESLSIEELYGVIERLLTLRRKNPYYIDFERYAQDLLLKYEIDDFAFWSYILDRTKNLTKLGESDYKFWRKLTLDHFLPEAEKFVEGAYISQIHQLLCKISSLKLKIYNDQNVQSLVQRICRQKVLRYTYTKMACTEMYIDMMSIIGEMLEDGSLSENTDDPFMRYDYLDKAAREDILPFFISCYSVIVMNMQEIKNLKQLEKISKVRMKFNKKRPRFSSSYNLPHEVQQCYDKIFKIKLEGVSDQQLQNVIKKYQPKDPFV